MMPHLLEELFALAGRSVHDYVTLKPLDPLYSLHFGDTVFTPSTNQDQTAEEIERLFPGNGSGYRRFMAEEGDKLERVIPLLQRPFQSIGDYVKRDVIHALPKLNAADTVYNRLSRYFDDERLRFSFTFQAKYLGMSPWECPGTFTILSYMEHRYGLYHPIGGVNRVLQAMADVIQEHGGRVHTASGVQRILVKDRHATGLLLENGEQVAADYVVIGADFGSAMTQLFEPGLLKKYTPGKLARKNTPAPPPCSIWAWTARRIWLIIPSTSRRITGAMSERLRSWEFCLRMLRSMFITLQSSTRRWRRRANPRFMC